MTPDYWLIVPVLLGVALMFIWAHAYYKFPRVMLTILRGVDIGPFELHLRATADWVHRCGSSHIVMAARDLSMLLAMYPMGHKVVYWAAVSVLSVTLWMLLKDALFSLKSINALEQDAPDINRFIKSAQRVVMHG